MSTPSVLLIVTSNIVGNSSTEKPTSASIMLSKGLPSSFFYDQKKFETSPSIVNLTKKFIGDKTAEAEDQCNVQNVEALTEKNWSND